MPENISDNVTVIVTDNTRLALLLLLLPIIDIQQNNYLQ